jgi:hypothetical protein
VRDDANQRAENVREKTASPEAETADVFKALRQSENQPRALWTKVKNLDS